MTSIKVKFRPSKVPGNDGTLYFQIIHERIVRQLVSDCHVSSSDWDEKHSMLKPVLNPDRQQLLTAVREQILADMERLRRIEKKLSDSGLPYTTDDIITAYRCFIDTAALSNYMETLICTLKHNNRIRTAETYRAALSSFRKFLGRQTTSGSRGCRDDIMLDRITSGLIKSYQSWLRGRGLTLNTVSFYMRILRSVYNRAVDSGIIDNCHPFCKVYTGNDKTVKRALSLPVIKKIKTLNLDDEPRLDYARDMFMMSFYLRGMSFVDMVYLRKTDLKNGILTYRRRKTGQQLQIEWTRDMQQTLDKYPAHPSGYLLPIITANDTNERSTYRNKSYNINLSLKKIATRLGLPINLTLYVARHSWASGARAKGIPLPVIAEGMGHGSETTTRIYLASLDTALVDRANAIILKSLK